MKGMRRICLFMQRVLSHVLFFSDYKYISKHNNNNLILKLHEISDTFKIPEAFQFPECFHISATINLSLIVIYVLLECKPGFFLAQYIIPFFIRDKPNIGFHLFYLISSYQGHLHQESNLETTERTHPPQGCVHVSLVPNAPPFIVKVNASAPTLSKHLSNIKSLHST